MDELVKKLAALGVPGVVLVVAINLTGLSGAAAITTALAALGPFGMLGGIATLGVIGLVAHNASQYGVQAITEAVIREQLKTRSKEDILTEVENYPISKELKLAVKDYANKVG